MNGTKHMFSMESTAKFPKAHGFVRYISPAYEIILFNHESVRYTPKKSYSSRDVIRVFC